VVRADGLVRLQNAVTGSGTVVLDPHTAAGTSGVDSSNWILAGTLANFTGSLVMDNTASYLTILKGGAGYTNGVFTNVALSGGSGTGAKANVTVTNGVITSVFVTDRGTGYATNDSLTVALGGALGNGTGAQINVGAGNAASSYRFQGGGNPSAYFGTADVVLKGGSQIYATGGTFTQNLTITGTGSNIDPAIGGIPYTSLTGLSAYSALGVLRFDNVTVSGNVVVDGAAKVMSYGGTTTYSGLITGATPTSILTFGGASTATGSTAVITGQLNVPTVVVNAGAGTQFSALGTDTLQIGNNGTTGFFSGNIILNGEWSNGGTNNSNTQWRSAILDFRRSDGYVLLPTQTISLAQQTLGGAASAAGATVRVNTTGTGVETNGASFYLANWVGSDKNNLIAITGGAGGRLEVGAGVANSRLVISNGSTLNLAYLGLGETQANYNSSAVQDAGTTVNAGQVRVGHWAGT
jgi:hypothetical protein